MDALLPQFEYPCSPPIFDEIGMKKQFLSPQFTAGKKQKQLTSKIILKLKEIGIEPTKFTSFVLKLAHDRSFLTEHCEVLDVSISTPIKLVCEKIAAYLRAINTKYILVLRKRNDISENKELYLQYNFAHGDIPISGQQMKNFHDEFVYSSALEDIGIIEITPPSTITINDYLRSSPIFNNSSAHYQSTIISPKRAKISVWSGQSKCGSALGINGVQSSFGENDIVFLDLKRAAISQNANIREDMAEFYRRRLGKAQRLYFSKILMAHIMRSSKTDAWEMMSSNLAVVNFLLWCNNEPTARETFEIWTHILDNKDYSILGILECAYSLLLAGCTNNAASWLLLRQIATI